MHSVRFLIPKMLRLLFVLTLASVVLSQGAFAKDEPKTYPEEGKIVGTGTHGARPSFTRTYKVETSAKIYELDCNKAPFLPGFIPGTTSTGGECGGDKKLKIGDVIHFRTKKEWVYLPIQENTGSGEQKLRIISEEMKSAAKPQDDTRP